MARIAGYQQQRGKAMIPFGLKLGERVEFLSHVDLYPHTMVYPGETGTVVHTETGVANVQLDNCHTGLADCDNCVWLHSPYCDDVQLRRARRKLSKRTIRLAAAGAMAALMAVGVFLGPEIARAYRGAAIDFKGHKLATHLYYTGDSIDIVNTAKRLRACIWQWEHTWKNTDTDTVVANSQSGGTSFAITDDYLTYHVRLPLPHGIAPGNYSFSATWSATCDHGDVLTGVQPPLYFTVMNGN